MTARRPIRDLERELKREPGNLALRLTLAAAYREAGRGGDALELYRSVARAYLEQGRSMQAAAVCRSALEIAPADSELYGMLQHVDRSLSQTQPPPFAAPVGSAPAMPVWGGPSPAPGPAAPSGFAGPPPAARPARVLEADALAVREVASVAPTVKHVPPPPPRVAPPTGRNSTLDTDTPLPDPLPLHESTGHDSLVEMAEVLTGPSRPSSPSSPSIPVPAAVLPPVASAPRPPARPPSGPPVVDPPPSPLRLARRPTVDDDSETIVPRTLVRGSQIAGAPPIAPAAEVRHAPRTAPAAPGPGAVPGATRRPAPPTRPPPEPRPPAGAVRPPPPARPIAPPQVTLPRLTASPPPPPARRAPPAAPIDDAPTDSTGASAARTRPVTETTPELAHDLAADMVTRKRPKLSAHDLALLELGPLSAEPADADGGTTTARHPAVLVDESDDGDTGDTGDTGVTGVTGVGGSGAGTGVTGVTPFDDEPTHPPGTAPGEGTLRGETSRPARAATDDRPTETGGSFEPSFDATLSSLGPDGSVLEGPLGVFSMLPIEAAHELSRRAVVKQYDPGESIIREGELGDACYVIVHGEVVVQRRADDGGPPVELARLSDGSLFGEFALLADRRRHATVVALTEVEAFEIPRLLLRELAAIFPEVGPALERFYRERLLANLLRTTPLFQLVPDEQRAGLLARFHPLHADSGQAIVQQGERAGGLYLIVLGAVDVVRRVGDRNAVVLATLGEGAYFGEMSLLSGEMASASVVAAGPCELAVLPPRDFYDLVAHNPELWTSMRTVATARRLANAQILAGHTGVV